MLGNEQGSPVAFKRMVSVMTQQSEAANEQDTTGKKQESENKLIEDEGMEQGRVRICIIHITHSLILSVPPPWKSYSCYKLGHSKLRFLPIRAFDLFAMEVCDIQLNGKTKFSDE